MGQRLRRAVIAVERWVYEDPSDLIGGLKLVLVVGVPVAGLLFGLVWVLESGGSDWQRYIDEHCLRGHYEERTVTRYNPAFKMPTTQVVRTFICDDWEPGTEPER